MNITPLGKEWFRFHKSTREDKRKTNLIDKKMARESPEPSFCQNLRPPRSNRPRRSLGEKGFQMRIITLGFSRFLALKSKFSLDLTKKWVYFGIFPSESKEKYITKL